MKRKQLDAFFALLEKAANESRLLPAGSGGSTAGRSRPRYGRKIDLAAKFAELEAQIEQLRRQLGR